MSVAQWLRLPASTPKVVVVSVVAYLGHLLFAPFAFSTELLSFVCMASFLVAVYRRELRIRFHVLYVPLVLYGIASVISALFAERSSHLLADLGGSSKAFLFVTALTLFRELPRAHTLATRMMLFFAFGTGAVVVFQFFALGRRDLEHRVTWPASHVMTLSGMLVAAGLFALALWTHDVRNRWLAAPAILAAFGVLLTFTRSAWLGWVVAVFVLIVLKRPRTLVWAVPAAILVVALLPLSFFSRMVSSFDTRLESNLDRIRMFEAGVEMIKDYPMLGVGPANVKEVYPLYRRHDAPRFRVPHLHNNVVQLWAERGVLALSAYALLLFLFLRECRRGWRGEAAPFADAGVAVAVGLFVAGLFEFNFGDTEVYWILLDVMALVVAAVERAQRSNELAPGAVAHPGP